MKIPVYTQEGKEAGEVALPKDVFEVKMNADLVHQVMISYAANKRQVSAHTQPRGEVGGGGRKPWRQKGTGRARQGSIRSPQWKGGGVVFGPRSERNWERKVNEKVARKALASALSGKWKGSRLAWLHAFPLSAPKTKQFVELMTQAKAHVPALVHAAWGDSRRHEVLLRTAGANAALTRASRNVPGIKAVSVQDAALEDAVGYKYIIATPDVIPVLLKRCARSKK